MPDLDWIHRFVPASARQSSGHDAPAWTLLLLHGTGGDENSLLGLGGQVAPHANLLSVRGRSLSEGFPRFFRRYSAVSYDQEEIEREAGALAVFTRAAAKRYGFAANRVVAVGYSNGANIALAILAFHPGVLAGAALLRAVMPLDDSPEAELSGTPLLLLSGARDPYAPHAVRLAPYLRQAGAVVEEVELPAGHELSDEDLRRLTGWLAALSADPRDR